MEPAESAIIAWPYRVPRIGLVRWEARLLAELPQRIAALRRSRGRDKPVQAEPASSPPRWLATAPRHLGVRCPELVTDRIIPACRGCLRICLSLEMAQFWLPGGPANGCRSLGCQKELQVEVLRGERINSCLSASTTSSSYQRSVQCISARHTRMA